VGSKIVDLKRWIGVRVHASMVNSLRDKIVTLQRRNRHMSVTEFSCNLPIIPLQPSFEGSRVSQQEVS